MFRGTFIHCRRPNGSRNPGCIGPPRVNLEAVAGALTRQNQVYVLFGGELAVCGLSQKRTRPRDGPLEIGQLTPSPRCLSVS